MVPLSTAKSKVSVQLLPSRVSDVPPPLLARRRVPPRFGLVLAGVVVVVVDDEPELRRTRRTAAAAPCMPTASGAADRPLEKLAA